MANCINRFSVCLLISTIFLFTAGCAIEPEPFQSEKIKQGVDTSRKMLFSRQEPVTGKITLYEAMARAVAYNLDHQVKRVEHALSKGNLELARYELLPRMTASMNYAERSNENASSSKSMVTGVQSLEVSTSQKKKQFSADIIYVWNILDFGVGYTKALQLADEVLISEEYRRKAIQNIIQDVRFAFWKAAHAQQLIPEMDALLLRVEKALEQSRQMKKSRVQDPVKILDYQQELLETVQHLWTMRKELSLAKIELAALMNLDPATKYELAFTQTDYKRTAQILSIEALENFALANRPEIWIESYNRRISSKEIKKEMLSMLPGLEINFTGNYDDNSYLFNNNWLQAGLSLSWNVFNLLTGPKALQKARLQENLSNQLYKSTIMMVLTQVQLAHQSYYIAMKDYKITSQLNGVMQNKLQHVKLTRKALAGNAQEEIRTQVAALSAKMNQGLAYAQLQGAMGQLFNTTGMDPLPARLNVERLEILAQFIEGYEQGLLSKFEVQNHSEVLKKDRQPAVSGLKDSKNVKPSHPDPGSSATFVPIIVEPDIEAPGLSPASGSTGSKKAIAADEKSLTPVISDEQKKQYRKAYDFFYEHFLVAPDNKNTNFLLGISAFGMGDYEEAVMAYERVLIIDPSAIDTRLEIARSYAALGSYEIAIEYLDEIIASDAPAPLSVEARSLLKKIKAAGSEMK